MQQHKTQQQSDFIGLQRAFWKKGRNHGYLFPNVTTVFFFISMLFLACGQQPSSNPSKERETADSIVILRKQGNTLRNKSHFEEALRLHTQGQQLAEALDDTLEWVQALNNIGTDYRRMEVLDMALEYHYSAWKLSEECADTSFTAKKNRVVSLNGLGNIYMTLGNYERADSVLRMALAGERELHSTVGQAINYANLGSIFEHHGRTDSAWIYYRKSMALNTEAGNELGISLCHTYFGSLYEKAHAYDSAQIAYKKAYQIMKDSKDKWHALNSLIALAGICHTTGEKAKAMEYLDKARQMATAIKSPEHLAQIYTLYYKHFKQAGNCRAALSAYETATAMQDSVVDMGKINHIQNASLRIEHNQQARKIAKADQRLEQERTVRMAGFAVLGMGLIVLVGILLAMIYANRLRHRNHQALKRIAAVREHFFTNITHEFRTPLTVILGLSHELQTTDAEEVKDKAETIQRQGEELLTLINQLLDISKIRSSVGNADWRNGDITACINMVVESYRDYAISRNINLHMVPAETVMMDFVPDYVMKVMNNLISNALKFTPEYGKISVIIRCKAERLLIDVADTGVGMDQETAQHIFEPFYQGENESQHIGTGVGLALVRQIMDAVKGKITVESTENVDTTFHISVPIHNSVKQAATKGDTTNTPLLPKTEVTLTDSEGGDNQCRLLIIEDNHDIAAYIGTQFDDYYAVSYATNGQEGLKKAQELVPDLIITDLMIPGIDGLEVCRQVRANEIISHIPIIILTAKNTEEDRIHGIEAGADTYLTKPFSSEELHIRVEKLLEGRQLLREKYAKVVAGNSEPDEAEAKGSSKDDLQFLAKVSGAIYMHLNRNREVDVSTIASEMCMSNSQFYRKLIALTGYNPSAYIQRVKIKKAKSLLDENPQMTFSEVADRCGFGTYSNFVRTFKNVLGIIPTEYRRQKEG